MPPENSKLIGRNFDPPDARAKVTGRARYPDDLLMDNLLHAKTVKSPYAHAKVKNIDTRPAKNMPGVKAVITYDDVPEFELSSGGDDQPGIDSEPRTFGYPVAAVAAEDEYTAATAAEAVKVEYEKLGHITEPTDALNPNKPTPWQNGATSQTTPDRAGDGIAGWTAGERVRWENADFSKLFPGSPGKFQREDGWGDLDAAWKESTVTIERSYKAHPMTVNPMEPRTIVAHWKSNGKVMLWPNTQDCSPVAHYVPTEFPDMAEKDLTVNTEYCGGGFGSKQQWNANVMIALPLSKKTNRPVKYRGTRREEHWYPRARGAYVVRVKAGFDDQGNCRALEMDAIGDGGAYGAGDVLVKGLGIFYESGVELFSPDALRLRGVAPHTNTPKKWPMRNPGTTQGALVLSQIFRLAAKKLDMDRFELRRKNIVTPGDRVLIPDELGVKTEMEDVQARPALEQCGQLFNWQEKKSRSGTREGSKIYGVGIGTSEAGAAWVGFDGLVIIRPDGMVETRQAVGNLGSQSHAAIARMVAETLKVPWDQVVVGWGHSDKGAYSVEQDGSATTWSAGLPGVKAAENMKTYLREIAANELGGSPDDYTVEDGAVFSGANRMTFAEAAQAGIQLGGTYTGEEIPERFKPLKEGEYERYTPKLWAQTVRAADDMIGNALVAFGHTSEADATFVTGSVSTMIEVAVDIETGKVEIEDMATVTGCGTIIHPRGARAQLEGGGIMGLGYALLDHMQYDPQTGIPVTNDWYQSKSPSIFDYPLEGIQTGFVDEPLEGSPHGAVGFGEPPMSASAAAVVDAVDDALDTDFQTFPLRPMKILQKIENGETRVK